MSAENGKHIIIVGGGASGVLLACHLLRNDDDDIRATLIEKRPVVGRGMAYSTAQPGHLLNVRATNMSAFADDHCISADGSPRTTMTLTVSSLGR